MLMLSRTPGVQDNFGEDRAKWAEQAGLSTVRIRDREISFLVGADEREISGLPVTRPKRAER
jgi:hypothetical protein